MEDDTIINLFWQKSEDAISKTDQKYGAYCKTIARNILHNDADAEECVNDAYLKTWDAIPPHRPTQLAAFLAKITRELSLDRYRMKNANKRGCGQVELALDELDECISDRKSVEQIVEFSILGQQISTFLNQQPQLSRMMFICRYWYFDSIRDIAKQFSISESQIKSNLFRTRKKLRIFLESEGVFVEKR